MKILIINKTIGLGSVGKIVEDLYSGITFSGNSCKVAYAKKQGNRIPCKDTIKIGSSFDRLLHAISSRFLGHHAFYSKFATKKLMKEIIAYAPDIVHLHGVYGYYINMKLLFTFLAEKNIKVITTLHSCWDFTGHCCYFDYAGCDQWKNGCIYCQQIASYPKAFFDNTKRNYEDKKLLYSLLPNCVVVTPSYWLKNLVSDSFLGTRQVEVIYNGIDRASFLDKKDDSVLKKYGIDSKKPFILSIANRWEPRKGLDDIIELASGDKKDFQIVVVGLDKKQSQILPKSIIGIQRTTNRFELSVLYSSATVLFNPTYEDNYPTVNLESIACHTPVVTYDTGGCAETIKKGKYGLIIKKRDFDALFSYSRAILDGRIKIDFSDLTWLEKQSMINAYLLLYKNIN